jgi:hypothetical protein
MRFVEVVLTLPQPAPTACSPQRSKEGGSEWPRLRQANHFTTSKVYNMSCAQHIRMNKHVCLSPPFFCFSATVDTSFKRDVS